MERELLDGYWQFVKKTTKDNYLYRNIYNGTEVILHNNQINNIISGKNSVAKVIMRKMAKEKNYTRSTFVTNNTLKKEKKWRVLHSQGIIDYGDK